jgi:hypothetical protein
MSSATGDGEGRAVWSDYARESYNASLGRVDELRSRARQLVAAIGVVIGFELTAIDKLVDRSDRGSEQLLILSMGALLIAVGWQLWLLRSLFQAGYGADKIPGAPEGPANALLKEDLCGKNRIDASETLGLYYAETESHLFDLANSLTAKLLSILRLFLATLLLLFAGCLGLVWRALS